MIRVTLEKEREGGMDRGGEGGREGGVESKYARTNIERKKKNKAGLLYTSFTVGERGQPSVS